MPENPSAQEEGDLRFGPFLDLPRFRQLTDKVLEVSVVFDQTVEHKPLISLEAESWRESDEIGGITDGTHHQLVDFLGWTGADKNRY